MCTPYRHCVGMVCERCVKDEAGVYLLIVVHAVEVHLQVVIEDERVVVNQ